MINIKKSFLNYITLIHEWNVIFKNIWLDAQASKKSSVLYESSFRYFPKS